MTRFMRGAFVFIGKQLLILGAVFAVMVGAVVLAFYLAIRNAIADSQQVTAKAPVVELKNGRMTVVRLDFEVDGRATRPCYFTYHEDSATWRLEC